MLRRPHGYQQTASLRGGCSELFILLRNENGYINLRLCTETYKTRNKWQNEDLNNLVLKTDLNLSPLEKLMKKGFVGGGGPVCCFLQQYEKVGTVK